MSRNGRAHLLQIEAISISCSERYTANSTTAKRIDASTFNNYIYIYNINTHCGRLIMAHVSFSAYALLQNCCCMPTPKVNIENNNFNFCLFTHYSSSTKIK